MAAPPNRWAADVIARDGSALHVRGITPEDAAALQTLHTSQSEASRVFRFFTPKGPLTDEELRHFTHVDGRQRVALVVTEPGTDAPLLAVARYDRFGDDAEVAFNVSDSQHGRGLGSLLLDHLATIGRDNGIVRFVADVLPTNGRMLAVFKDVGYTITARTEDGVVGVVLDLEATGRSREVAAARERYAEARSMDAVLSPRSVLATSSQPLPDDGADTLAIVDCPDGEVPAMLRLLGRKGVPAAVVTSGAGNDSVAWNRDVASAARSSGLRLVGPGSFGVVTVNGVNATKEPRLTGGGEIAVFVQSLTSAEAVARELVERSIPVAAFLAAGNRLDVSGNDVMQFFTDRGTVGAVVVCLDSIGNPRKFARVARRLSATTPLICHFASRTGQEAPPGHPVRTSALPRAVLSSMLRQVGAIEAPEQEDLISLAVLAAAGAWRGGKATVVGVEVTAPDGTTVGAADPDEAARWVQLLSATKAPASLLPVPDGVRPGRVRRLLREAADGAADPTLAVDIASSYGIDRSPFGTIESVEDPLYGPVIAATGTGGTATRMVPLAAGEPEAMLHEAGLGPEDADLLLRVARLVDDHPRITRLRITPDSIAITLGPAPRPRRARGAFSLPDFRAGGT